MSYEPEKDYTPIMTVKEVDEWLGEWGGMIPIVDTMKKRTGDVSWQRDALNHNNHVFPVFVELAKNELVDLKAEYNRQFLVELDKLTKKACEEKNITSAGKRGYVEKILESTPESIGAQIEKFKNKIMKLEEVAKAQMNLLWTYNK